jgi:hypothetical protein
VNVLALIVPGSIAALKVAATFTFKATPGPLLTGMVEVTVGAAPTLLAGGTAGSLPQAASRKERTETPYRPVLRRVATRWLQRTRPNCGRGVALAT